MKNNRIIPPLQGSVPLWLILIIFTAFALVIDLSFNYFIVRQFRNDQKISATLELAAIRARLEEGIGKNLSLIYGMGAHISIQPRIGNGEFNKLAQVLMAQSSSLKNIAAAPDFIIRYVYPLEGNEKIIGLDYRKIPDQWDRALAAKKTGQMAVAGPINLVQGGRGLIARVPVFEKNTGKFWGLVSSVIDFDILKQQVGLDQINKRFVLAIRGKDGQGDKGETFWGAPELFDADSQAIIMPVSLPSGYWQMAAVPTDGWAVSSPYQWIIHLSTLWVTMLICIIAIQMSRSRLILIENENRLKAMSDASHDALMMIDSKDTITFWNPASELMFGYTREEAIGKKLHDLIVLPDEVNTAKAGLKHFSSTGKGPVLGRAMEMVAVRKSGEKFPVERSVSAFQLKNKWYAVGSVRDISARKDYEHQLKKLATTDSLTGLYNRRYFMEHTDKQFRQAIRYKKNFALLMFDLDHFKKINDTYGHDAGDKVLCRVADILNKTLRASDIFGRIGGEEFAIAMPETRIDYALKAAERLRDLFDKTKVATKTGNIKFTASFGISQLSKTEPRLSGMIKMADIALYKAKKNGRNRVEQFAPGDDDPSTM